MIFKQEAVLLKYDTPCILRSPHTGDAAEMMRYLKATAGETHFLRRYPEEIDITFQQEVELLERAACSDTDVFISAFIGGELAGNASLRCAGVGVKARHRCCFGIAIRQKFWGLGIGNALTAAALSSARSAGYGQIELTVFSDNTTAQALYEKFGFERWGVIPRAYKLKDGTFCDEIIMGLLL